MRILNLRKIGSYETLYSRLEQSRLHLALIPLAWFVTYTQIILSGRASRTLVYDDISYFRSGLSLVLDYDNHGNKALIDWLLSPPHSLWSEAIAAIGLRLTGLNQWGPYLINSICLSVLFFYFARQFSKNNFTAALIASFLIISPLGYIAFDQFRPDIAYILALSIGVKKIFLKKENFKTDEVFRTLIYTLFFMVLIKPTWFAFTSLVLGLTLAKYVLHWKKTDHSNLVKYILFLIGEIALLSLWYGDHIYHYVFQWGLTENGSTKLMSGPDAIKMSMSEAINYIGMHNSVVLLALITFALFRVLNEKRDVKTLFEGIAIILITPIVLSLPVLISGMPSPFQGLLWILPVVFLSLGSYSESLQKRGKSFEILVATLVTLLLFSATPLTKVGLFPEVSKPIKSVEKVVDSLVEDCLTFDICDNTYPSARTVHVGMLAFGIISPEAIQYYSLVKGVQLFPQLLARELPIANNTSLNITDLDYLITYGKPHFTSVNDNWSNDNLYLRDQKWKVVGNSEHAIYTIWRNPKYVK